MDDRLIVDGQPTIWTSQSVERLWAHLASTANESAYFSKQVGAALRRLLDDAGVLKPGNSVLDLGCGPGYLIEHLLRSGVNCAGTDASPAAVREANGRLGGAPGWQGAYELGDPTLGTLAPFDVVTCIETLEHTDDSGLAQVLSSIRSLLRPGVGVALFTTPNAEDLRRNEVFCPNCEIEFHPVQHLRSFDSASLSALLRSHGFEVVFCAGVDLYRLQGNDRSWRDWTARDAKHSARRAIAAADNRLRHRAVAARDFPALHFPGPHLCALVRRL